MTSLHKQACYNVKPCPLLATDTSDYYLTTVGICQRCLCVHFLRLWRFPWAMKAITGCRFPLFKRWSIDPQPIQVPLPSQVKPSTCFQSEDGGNKPSSYWGTQNRRLISELKNHGVCCTISPSSKRTGKLIKMSPSVNPTGHHTQRDTIEPWGAKYLLHLDERATPSRHGYFVGSLVLRTAPRFWRP